MDKRRPRGARASPRRQEPRAFVDFIPTEARQRDMNINFQAKAEALYNSQDTFSSPVSQNTPNKKPGRQE